jgi:hypothetical protein
MLGVGGTLGLATPEPVYFLSPRNGLQEKHKSLAFHRPPYHLLQQRDSQDTSAEQR